MNLEERLRAENESRDRDRQIGGEVAAPGIGLHSSSSSSSSAAATASSTSSPALRRPRQRKQPASIPRGSPRVHRGSSTFRYRYGPPSRRCVIAFARAYRLCRTVDRSPSIPRFEDPRKRPAGSIFATRSIFVGCLVSGVASFFDLFTLAEPPLDRKPFVVTEF